MVLRRFSRVQKIVQNIHLTLPWHACAEIPPLSFLKQTIAVFVNHLGHGIDINLIYRG